MRQSQVTQLLPPAPPFSPQASSTAWCTRSTRLPRRWSWASRAELASPAGAPLYTSTPHLERRGRACLHQRRLPQDSPALASGLYSLTRHLSLTAAQPWGVARSLPRPVGLAACRGSAAAPHISALACRSMLPCLLLRRSCVYAPQFFLFSQPPPCFDCSASHVIQLPAEVGTRRTGGLTAQGAESRLCQRSRYPGSKKRLDLVARQTILAPSVDAHSL